VLEVRSVDLDVALHPGMDGADVMQTGAGRSRDPARDGSIRPLEQGIADPVESPLAVVVVFELEVVASVVARGSTCRPGRSAAEDLVDVRGQLALPCDRDGVGLLKAGRIYEGDPIATIHLDMAGGKAKGHSDVAVDRGPKIPEARDEGAPDGGKRAVMSRRGMIQWRHEHAPIVELTSAKK
jgi:hypothetical protein